MGRAPEEGFFVIVTEPGFDTREFRNALGRFASSVTAVTARYEEQTHGMTASAFVSVSLNPPLVLVSLDNRSYICTGFFPPPAAIRRFGLANDRLD